jgi:hypothetical protein
LKINNNSTKDRKKIEIKRIITKFEKSNIKKIEMNDEIKNK